MLSAGNGRYMRTYFRNRGHFCNYCRKVVSNKVYGKYQAPTLNMNEALWHIWEKTPERIPEFIRDLSALQPTEKLKGFKHQQQALIDKYMEV